MQWLVDEGGPGPQMAGSYKVEAKTDWLTIIEILVIFWYLSEVGATARLQINS